MELSVISHLCVLLIPPSKYFSKFPFYYIHICTFSKILLTSHGMWGHITSNMVPWCTGYFKLKEFEKTSEGGRLLSGSSLKKVNKDYLRIFRWEIIKPRKDFHKILMWEVPFWHQKKGTTLLLKMKCHREEPQQTYSSNFLQVYYHSYHFCSIIFSMISSSLSILAKKMNRFICFLGSSFPYENYCVK
jgi:hypothetical protein